MCFVRERDAIIQAHLKGGELSKAMSQSQSCLTAKQID